MGISFYLDPQLHQSPRAPPDCFGLDPGLLFHTPKILTCRELLKLGYSTFICHVKKNVFKHQTLPSINMHCQ